MTESIEKIADEMDEATVAYTGHHSSGTFRRLATRLRALANQVGDDDPNVLVAELRAEIQRLRSLSPPVVWQRRCTVADWHQWHEINREFYERAQEDSHLRSHYEFRALYTHPSADAPGVAVDESLIDELLWLAETPFNAECCNASFPISALRRICKAAADALPPAKENGRE